MKATWKDSDIKKNPKYAASPMGADGASFDISALRKRKGGAKVKSITPVSKDSKPPNAMAAAF